MSLTAVFQIVFAAGCVLAVGSLAAAAFRLVGRNVLGVIAVIVIGLCAAAWVAFALEPSRTSAVSAGGLTIAAVAAASALGLARLLRRLARIDAELERAQKHLHDVLARDAEDRSAELERVLARARAESVSLLSEQERRIADERRAAVAERERRANDELVEAVAKTQTQIEQRLNEWSKDLDRHSEAMRARLAEVGRRQRQLFDDAEARVAADAERLQTESEEQREAVVRLRAEVQRSLEETSSAVQAELDGQAVERRRALHELEDRLRRRERELTEQVERDEAEAAQRLQAGLGDVQRRQLEQVERTLERTSAALAEEATQQFAALIKQAREDAARRLARELERAVAVFAREAESTLAERLAHVGDAGAQRLDRRLAEIASSLDRQRDEFVQAFGVRLGDAEDELRRRLGDIAADADAERAVIEAHLQELIRRIDELTALRTA
jgi:hypothetical protein